MRVVGVSYHCHEADIHSNCSIKFMMNTTVRNEARLRSGLTYALLLSPIQHDFARNAPKFIEEETQ